MQPPHAISGAKKRFENLALKASGPFRYYAKEPFKSLHLLSGANTQTGTLPFIASQEQKAARGSHRDFPIGSRNLHIHTGPQKHDTDTQIWPYPQPKRPRDHHPALGTTLERRVHASGVDRILPFF